MKLLSIDPATKCGWAWTDGSTTISGTWDLSVKRDESSGMRLFRLRGKLTEILKQGIDVCVFEAARHGAPAMQGALVVQSELQGVLKLFCEDNKIESKGYSPSEIKKHATGKGNANKGAMLDAARERWPNVTDDNEADALWLLSLALQTLVPA